MGQTLAHGIYLPDEGERNCYSGLAANWQLLDNSVGTVAEHTTALAGKAPLVHTHVKADITDFPALATVATSGSYNDLNNIPASFTPSSHTHGNLTNDGKLGTASRALVTDANKNIVVSSVTSTELGYLSGVTSAIQTQIAGKASAVHTHTKSDITDLFNSANTWSEVNTFSKHQIFQAGAYFYNSDSNAATSGLNLRNSKITKGGTSDSGSQIIQFLDKDNKFLSQVATVKVLSGTTQLQFTLGNIDSDNNSITGGITFSLAIDGTKQFLPNSNKTHNLGNSSYQWKSLNGVNPGALSLPVTALNNTYDISGNITDLTGGNNAITAARTGWIFVKSDNATEISIENTTTGMGASDHSAAAATLMVSIPVTSGETLNIIANCTSIDKAYLLPCQGNV